MHAATVGRASNGSVTHGQWAANAAPAWNYAGCGVTLFAPMAPLPSAPLTLLFTDIEGSTRLVRTLGDRFEQALETHNRLLRDAFAAHGGTEFDSGGDGFFVVFPHARDATRLPTARGGRTRLPTI